MLPRPLTAASWSAWQLIDEVAFLASLSAVAGMGAVLSERRWLLAQMAPSDRYRVELAGLSTAAAIGTVLALAPAGLGLAGPDPRFGSLIHLAVARAGVVLHLAALGVVALRLPWRGHLVAVGLFGIAWGVPALIPAKGSMADLVRGVLDPTVHLGWDWASRLTWARTFADMMPVAALLLWGRWLPWPPPPRT